jgi:hypothetical protein
MCGNVRRFLQPDTRMPSESSPPKVRATLYVSAELLDAARNATVHLAGYPARLTLTKLVETALRNELQRLQQMYNQGQAFPPRDEDLRGGRPIAA